MQRISRFKNYRKLDEIIVQLIYKLKRIYTLVLISVARAKTKKLRSSDEDESLSAADIKSTYNPMYMYASILSTRED